LDTGAALVCGSWHPDGLLLGVGDARGVVALYDVQTCTRALALDAHTGQGGVTSLAFSENGYHVATSGGINDNSVKLWDLRKNVSVVEACVIRMLTSSVSDVLAYTAFGAGLRCALNRI
jgi:pre-mRNA-processing factor 19